MVSSRAGHRWQLFLAGLVSKVCYNDDDDIYSLFGAIRLRQSSHATLRSGIWLLECN